MAAIQDQKWQSLQLTSDYKGSDFTASLTMGNPDFLSGTGMGILHYLQSVTPKLALGAELAYQAAPQIPGGHIGVLSAVGRYTGSDFTFSSTLANSGALHACYYQKCSQDLRGGAEHRLVKGVSSQESIVTSVISVIVNIETRYRGWCRDDPDIDSVIFTTISSSVYKQYSSILPPSQLVSWSMIQVIMKLSRESRLEQLKLFCDLKPQSVPVSAKLIANVLFQKK